jgi:hypothetical protein
MKRLRSVLEIPPIGFKSALEQLNHQLGTRSRR